jgi:hypothetical protein
LFTGGPGHDVFQFSTEFRNGGGATITDFSHQDTILIDIDPAFPPTITFTNSGTSTTVDAVAAGASVHVVMQGTFDTSLFHVANDGAGHDVITYGHGNDFLLG